MLYFMTFVIYFIACFISAFIELGHNNFLFALVFVFMAGVMLGFTFWSWFSWRYDELGD